MSNKKTFLYAYHFCLLFAVLIIFGCANKQMITGGPRDRTPPKLLKATPANMNRNFKAKTIQLDFDEFFKLTNQYTEITMSPTPAKTPEYKLKNKSLIINLKDSLEKNTTYVINFGKAIQDVNESNVLKNFTYVFSTGAHIDSLSLSGKVVNTLTGEREKDVTVMLFTLKQDSLLFGKKRPTIFTTTDTAGNFSLNNLHPDDYRIYALKEATPNKIYDNDAELIAFNKNVIHLTKDTDNVQLRLFKQIPAKFRLVDQRFDPDGKLFFTFNRQLEHPSVVVSYPPDFDKEKMVYFSKTKDTAQVFMRNMDFDSIRMSFMDNNKPLDTIYKKKGRKEAFRRNLTFQYDISNDKLRPNTDLVIRANFPLASYDASLISLKEDSTDITNFTIVKDSVDARMLTLKYRWHQVVNYTLALNEGTATDIYGDKNRRTVRRFQIDKPENYSSLTLTVSVPDSGRSYVVELMNATGTSILRSDVITKNASLVYKNLITSKYKVRVIYDSNKNGKWDTGNIKQKVQPENIWVADGLITLRPNWDQVTPIAIPKEPINP